MVIHVLYMHSKVLLYNIRLIAQILLNNVTTVIQYQNSCNYEKKLWTVKQWWSTIPPISTKRAITSHLHSLNTKKGNHDNWLGKWILILHDSSHIIQQYLCNNPYIVEQNFRMHIQYMYHHVNRSMTTNHYTAIQSTKRAITSHLHSLNTKKGNHDNWLGNLGPSLGQAQQCGGYWISKGNKYINKREKKRDNSTL
jgi:hypothetical protein